MRWQFTVDAMKLIAMQDTAVSINATVYLHGKVSDVYSKVVQYKWDFNGDGKWEDSVATSDTIISRPWTYTHEAVYKAVLYARDDSGMVKLDTAIITVGNTPPVIDAIRPDTTISIYDSVPFYGMAHDVDGVIKEYAWDFNGDGTFEFTSATTMDAGYKYIPAGVYKAILRLTDDDAKVTRDTVKVMVLQDAPVANAGIDTSVRINSPVFLKGTATQQFGTIVIYKWDFDGNGIYDDSSISSSTMSHTYTHETAYNVRFYVRDDDGNEATDIRVVTVQNSAPVITSIRPDTTVSIKDSITLRATAVDNDGIIKEYAWDFTGDGTFEYTSATEIYTGYRYNTAGIYNAVIRVTDDDNKVTKDTAVITVLQDAPQIVFFTKDTVVEHGGSVRCSIYVQQQFGTMAVEIDTANNGNFISLGSAGLAGGKAYSFTTGTACSWDSVKVRVTDDDGNIMTRGFKVDIRPQPLTIISTDSTVNTITVNYLMSSETDFAEYRIYRDTNNSVDSTDALWSSRGVLSK